MTPAALTHQALMIIERAERDGSTLVAAANRRIGPITSGLEENGFHGPAAEMRANKVKALRLAEMIVSLTSDAEAVHA